MDDFFDKIKKKLSVDNILEFMKDGKLKEEIKQTLTAKVNLNERSKQDEARSSLEVPITSEPNKHVTIENIQHSTTEGQSKVNVLNESRITEEKILEVTRKQMIVEIDQGVTDKKNKLIKEDIKDQIEDKKLNDIKTEDHKAEDDKIGDEKVEVKSNSNVTQKTLASQSQQKNEEPLNHFEIFMG